MVRTKMTAEEQRLRNNESARRYRMKNAKLIAEKQRQIRATPEGREKANGAAREYQRRAQAVPGRQERLNEIQRQVRTTSEGRKRLNKASQESHRKDRATQEGRAKATAASSTWAKNNRSKAKAKNHRRKARLAGLEGGHWDDEDETLIRDWLEDECPACLESLDGGGQMDHMIPTVAGNEGGASNEPWNMILLCGGIGGCNQSKGGRTFEQWREDDPTKFSEEQWDELFGLLDEYDAMWAGILEESDE